MDRLIVALKIGGAASLGILTGIHFNFSLETLCSITALSSAGQAQKAFTIALGLLRSTVRPLEFFATASLAGAYFLSPATGKHPYLFIASAPVLLSIAIEKLKLSGVEFGVLRVQTSGERRGTGADVEVNGEVVRAGVDEWARWGIVRGMIVGSGFLLSLVGLYGDHK